MAENPEAGLCDWQPGFCAIHPASGCRVCTRSRLPENVPCAECRRKMEKSLDG